MGIFHSRPSSKTQQVLVWLNPNSRPLLSGSLLCCFTWSYRLPSPCSYNVFLLQNLSPVSCSISTLCYQIISNFKEIQVSHSSPTQVTWKMFNRFAEFMDICQTGSTALSEGEGFQLGISRNIRWFSKEFPPLEC